MPHREQGSESADRKHTRRGRNVAIRDEDQFPARQGSGTGYPGCPPNAERTPLRERAMPDDLTRRAFLATAAMAAPGLLALSRSDAMPGLATPAMSLAGSSRSDPAIRPFRVNVPEAELADLRRRIAATRWPERETVGDASQGVQLATMQALARYWAAGHSWRRAEARLNAFPQF